jgi:NAD+ synthase (glutamine-hydrolysing)
LGLWDYMRKSYSRGFVVSLSGGADSSAIVSLCFLALQAAEKELGFEGIKKRLSYIPWISAVTQIADLQKRLVTTLYQGTVNSSLQTRSSAKVLAEGIGSTHYELEIDTIVGEYRELIEEAIGRALTWEQDDITLQNVQARVRSPSAWMLANINQALLLATSNRSEASVGYATMDGDTSGSISPIAGIDKSFLRTWLAWAEAKIPALQQVNSLEPSAELRPLATKQVDEEDLMPYPILNALERWAFYERKSPSECQEVLFLTYGAHFSKEKLSEFAHRFFRLWARNQWKRERYAPGFHVDEYSLDPKSWLRFPILSAGLEKDLPPE